jgi:hypothetical protein
MNPSNISINNPLHLNITLNTLPVLKVTLSHLNLLQSLSQIRTINRSPSPLRGSGGREEKKSADFVKATILKTKPVFQNLWSPVWNVVEVASPTHV